MVMTTVLLALAWFAALNLAASLLAWTAAVGLQRTRICPRAGVLLTVRLFPAAASLLLTLVLFVPAHWITEPRGLSESFGSSVYLLSLAGAALIGRAIVRVIGLARADRRLRGRERVSAVVPHLRESEALPGLALAGILRTRILAGPHVVGTLTSPELDVAIAHELAHHRAVDNLKRWALYCTPDFFGWSANARKAERDWHAAAESLADARAVGGDAQRAIDLASALIKVARLSLERPRVETALWSTFNDPSLLKHRVLQLTRGIPVAAPSHPRRAASTAVLAVGAVAMLVPLLSDTIHTITEAVIAFLP